MGSCELSKQRRAAGLTTCPSWSSVSECMSMCVMHVCVYRCLVLLMLPHIKGSGGVGTSHQGFLPFLTPGFCLQVHPCLVPNVCGTGPLSQRVQMLAFKEPAYISHSSASIMRTGSCLFLLITTFLLPGSTWHPGSKH